MASTSSEPQRTAKSPDEPDTYLDYGDDHDIRDDQSPVVPKPQEQEKGLAGEEDRRDENGLSSPAAPQTVPRAEEQEKYLVDANEAGLTSGDAAPQSVSRAEEQEKYPIAEEDRSSRDNTSDDVGGPGAHDEKAKEAGFGDDEEKYEITEEDCYDELGYSFSSAKKWYILTVIFIVQVSMNFNTSLYSNAITGISDAFGVSAQAARVGAAIFLITYAFGCELWAPWSEEFGRWPILQLSLGLVNIWQIPVALAPNFGTILVGRALGGLSSAGGSVTLGMIADLWEADKQQYAVAFVVFSSVGGSILGPIVGGFSEAYLKWEWSIWIQLIFGGAVQLLHFFTVPETRTTIMMNRIAKRRRKEGNPNIWGPDELVPFKDRFSVKEVLQTWIRPFRMFLTEPIVLVLSLLSGFSDALVFMFIQSFSIVYKQYGFSTVQIGLSFIPIGVGYLIAWAAFIPAIKRNIAERRNNPSDEKAQYESRLWFLLYTAPCLPIGLFGFAWTVLPSVPWIASMIFSAIIGIANYSIYMATIDYMICAYGPYSASATGGNGWSRDFLAGVLTVPATPFFTNIGAASGRNLEYASTILACIATLLVCAVYVIYWKGPTLRKNSPFAQQLADARAEDPRRISVIQRGSYATERRNSAFTSRQNSMAARGNSTGMAMAGRESVVNRGSANGVDSDVQQKRRP